MDVVTLDSSPAQRKSADFEARQIVENCGLRWVWAT